MLDIKYIREHVAEIKENVKNRSLNLDIDELLKLDDIHREYGQQLQELETQRNAKSKTKPTTEGIEEVKTIKREMDVLLEKIAEHDKKYQPLLALVPNMTLQDVPVGPDETGNIVLRTWGTPPSFNFKPKDHVELGEALGMIDTDRAAKVAGARFAYLKGDAALLEFAIVQYVFSLLTSPSFVKTLAAKVGFEVSSNPFIAVVPPVMIRPEVFRRMARLSDADKDERYYLPADDLYLVGSAEHTLGSMHIDEILDEKELPIRYIGFSTSFRREAGSYGKDTKGILRVHQFDKLEMESFCFSEQGLAEQELFVAVQEYLLQQLKLPYRVMMICTGDMGRPDARQIDMETWMPAQGTYRETHTADYMTDYQTRRLMTRTRRGGRTELVHTNDATAIAIGRILIAIMENYQNADGTITIPKVLRPSMGGREVIGR